MTAKKAKPKTSLQSLREEVITLERELIEKGDYTDNVRHAFEVILARLEAK